MADDERDGKADEYGVADGSGGDVGRGIDGETVERGEWYDDEVHEEVNEFTVKQARGEGMSGQEG